MKLDLKKDAQKIRRFIEKRIHDYPDYENLGPGDDNDAIALITLGYYFEQIGYFALVFDTRREADNDGEWTGHIENDVNVLPFPQWCAAFEKLCDGVQVEVVMPDGKSRTLGDSDDHESVARLFGEVIRDTVLSLRESCAFDALPLTPKAFFVIEEFDGNWGWPVYEKRKKLAWLRKK